MPGAAERLAGTGLAIATVTIVALAALALAELEREAELHREVIAGLQAKDSIESLRTELDDLAHATRLAVLGQGVEAARTIERRSVEIDAELDYLSQHPSREVGTDAFDALAQAARALVVNARSIAASRAGGRRTGHPAAREAERLAAEAATALERTLQAQNARINDRTLAQIRTGETLRAYVSWLLAGSCVVLVGLFGFYRWAKAREHDALRRIEHLAHHDTVTGLPNRLLLADRLQNEVARAARTGRTFAVLLFDLDGFKQVNDTWGHPAGDALLATVAARARQCMRASDTVGRIGGDEFLAILPETTQEGALQVAEKVRDALKLPYVLGEAVAEVSASVGVSVYPDHAADAEALQRTADAALYEAKREGRNRVKTAKAAPRVAASAPA